VTTPAPKPPITFPAPKPASVKEQTGKAKDILSTFEIGKEGSIFEDGVAGQEQLEELADALNITVLISESLQQWEDTNSLKRAKVESGTTGWHRRENQQQSTIHLQNFDRTDIEFLTTFAHEIAHAIESRALNHKTKVLTQYNALPTHPKSGRGKGAILPFQPNSFRELMNNTLKGHKNSKVIKQEIDRLQDEMMVFFGANPELGSTQVRQSGYHSFMKYLEITGDNKPYTDKERKTAIERFYIDQKKFNKYRKYKKQTAEFAVDPLWVYLVNPKLMKREFPNTAKLIQEFFNKPESDFPMTFHANPIMTILAIVLAGVAAKEREEEEKQQPPQGLPPGQGILSV
jgi:hypothetical protein